MEFGIEIFMVYRSNHFSQRAAVSVTKGVDKKKVFWFLFSKTFLVSFAKILVEIAFVKVFSSLTKII